MKWKVVTENDDDRRRDDETRRDETGSISQYESGWTATKRFQKKKSFIEIYVTQEAHEFEMVREKTVHKLKERKNSKTNVRKNTRQRKKYGNGVKAKS